MATSGYTVGGKTNPPTRAKKNLYLFSHDPNNDDEVVNMILEESLKIIDNRKSPLKCFVAKESLEINLDW